MGLRPIKLKHPKCEICGQFIKLINIRLFSFQSSILALEPEEPCVLCLKCYKEEVYGQDQRV